MTITTKGTKKEQSSSCRESSETNSACDDPTRRQQNHSFKQGRHSIQTDLDETEENEENVVRSESAPDDASLLAKVLKENDDLRKELERLKLLLLQEREDSPTSRQPLVPQEVVVRAEEEKQSSGGMFGFNRFERGKSFFKENLLGKTVYQFLQFSDEVDCEEVHRSLDDVESSREVPDDCQDPDDNDDDDDDVNEGSNKSNNDSSSLSLHHLKHRHLLTSNHTDTQKPDNELQTFEIEHLRDDHDDCQRRILIHEHNSDIDPEDDISANFDSLPFGLVVKDRAIWLIGLLALQSCSSFILKKNEELLQSHLEIVHFLTMLVGAGGNAGNQACVRVIRGLAVGTLNGRTMRHFLLTESKMALCLSGLLSLSGFIRAAIFRVPIAETVAITSSLLMIVVISIGLGALLPLFMKFIGIDPAHSSTTIQVIMDILGVTITVHVSYAILETTLGHSLISFITNGSG